MTRLMRMGSLGLLVTICALLPASGIQRGPVLGYLAPAVARAGDPVGPDGASTSAGVEVFVPPTTPRTTYASFDGAAFRPDANDDGSTRYVTGGGISPAASGWYYVHLDLPQGATITELAWYWRDNSAANMSFYLYRFLPNGAGGSSLWSGQSSGASTDIQTTSASGLSHALDNTTGTYVLYMVAPASDTGLVLYGARVGYVAASPAFYPIAPARVYDSRCTGGMLARNENRTVSLATGVASSSCVPGPADVVPTGARAVTYNLTVVSTVNRGKLALVPHGGTYTGSTSINWYTSGLVLGNGGVVTLGGDRQLDVYAEGTSGSGTHFVIDVTGYYE